MLSPDAGQISPSLWPPDQVFLFSAQRKTPSKPNTPIDLPEPTLGSEGNLPPPAPVKDPRQEGFSTPKAPKTLFKGSYPSPQSPSRTIEKLRKSLNAVLGIQNSVRSPLQSSNSMAVSEFPSPPEKIWESTLTDNFHVKPGSVSRLSRRQQGTSKSHGDIRRIDKQFLDKVVRERKKQLKDTTAICLEEEEEVTAEEQPVIRVRGGATVTLEAKMKGRKFLVEDGIGQMSYQDETWTLSKGCCCHVARGLTALVTNSSADECLVLKEQ
jgi:hypothetical protein